MKKLLVILAVLLLAAPIIQAKGVAGIGLGFDVKNVKDPGFAVQSGLQEQLGENSFTRLMVNKLNYGNAVAVDNVGLKYLYFLGISQKMDAAVCMFGDAEAEGDNYGYGFGAEFDYYKIHIPETIPILGDLIGGIIGNEFGAFTSFDLVRRPETKFYFQWSLGITFLSQ